MNPINTLFEVATPIQRKLLENVRYVPETECWEWTGKTHKGTLNLCVDGLRLNARKISFTEFIGPLIDGDDWITVSCGTKLCVCPSHLTPKGVKPSGYWTKNKCAEEAMKYSNREQFRKGNGSAYRIVVANKWLGEICTHMVRSATLEEIWTKNKCAEEAMKYSRRSDFFRHNSQAYNVTRRNGWLDELCAHMGKSRKRRVHSGYWTKNKCAEEAMKYSNREQFRKGSSGAHNAASKNKWLDEICSHMRRLTPIAA